MMAKRIADDGVLPDIDGGRIMHFRCPMTTLAALFDIGPTHHLIGHLPGNEPIGAFLFHPITRKSDVRGSHRALWSADRKTLIRLVVDPTHKGRVINRKQAARVKAKAGALHYARGIRWTSQPLLAASTEHKVFGGRAWTTLMHGDDHVRKAFALWANSTLGLITHWTRAGRAQRGRANTQVRAIHAMPCPNLSELDGGRLAGAAAAFEEFAYTAVAPRVPSPCGRESAAHRRGGGGHVGAADATRPRIRGSAPRPVVRRAHGAWRQPRGAAALGGTGAGR